MISQVSVFLENRAGQLAELTGVLAKNKIDIRALNIAETVDYGMLRLIVADKKRAMEALQAAGFVASESDVLTISIPDRPGGLAEALAVLDKEKIDISYMYSIFSRLEGKAYMVMKVSDLEKAEKVLNEKGIHIPDNKELDIQ